MTTLTSTLTHHFLIGKQDLAVHYRTHQNVHSFFSGSLKLRDGVIKQLSQNIFHHNEITILATGGFGRGEIYPFSDTDIALILPDNVSGSLKEQAAEFVQALWDIGLSPAPKIGTLDELLHAAQHDLTGDTALMECRWLFGNQNTMQKLQKQLMLQRDIVGFIDGKLSELEQRHAKSQGSGSLLEPNVKTCPGGLRDIHTMIWLAKVQGLPFDFASLVGRKILTRAEALLLVKSHQTLAKMRIELHWAAQKSEDKLLFDWQNKIAQTLDLKDDSFSLKSEKLMKAFYRAVKTVRQLDGIILPMLKERVFSAYPRHFSVINAQYEQHGRLIAVRDKHLFRKDEKQIFNIIRLLQDNPDIDGIDAQTLRLFWNAAQKIGRRFRKNPANRKLFIELFKNGKRLTQILRTLNLYGVLGKYLPQFDRIVGLLQHDLFHIYPVDDHILTVVRNLRRLAKDEYAHEFPFASALMHNFQRKDILYLAALFHDIAKGRGGDHDILGAKDARQFALDHFLTPDETELLAWLVEHHLLLSMTAQKEDIANLKTIAKFCQVVDNPEKLSALYLLTVADVRGTNPAIWNSWKAGLFDNLFQAALQYLQGTKNNQVVVAGRRRQIATNELNLLNIQEKEQKKLFHSLGDAYFVRYQKADIRWHLQHIAQHPQTACFALRFLDNNVLQVLVYMPNAERLFVGLCQIFSHFRLDIVQANAYLTEHDFILDTFVLYPPPMIDDDELQYISGSLKNELQQFLSSKKPSNYLYAPKILPNRRAKHQPIATTVSIDESDDGQFTLYVITHNRPYLLATIADTLSQQGINIRHAQINTLGERVEDSFLIDAPQLVEIKNRTALKNNLLQAIDT
ncbi:MAG: [Neisseriaceae bacterium]|nr:[protein-PII] uridylyltransferase [Neisseriaceae bacterium]